MLRHLFRRLGKRHQRHGFEEASVALQPRTGIRVLAPSAIPTAPPNGVEPAAQVVDLQRQMLLGEAFTPMRPQRTARRFVGRQAQLHRILQVLEEERGHVVLYADRGHGKTSLANLVAEAARRAGHMVARFTCTADADFDSILRGLARDLPRSFLAVPVVPDEGTEGCEAALPPGRASPRDVIELPARLAGRRLVLMLDEFDRVTDEATRTRLADTIKQASDRTAALSIVVIGVSDSLEQLLGRHPSIQRNVIGVPLPLLADEDVRAIVTRGAEEAGLVFPAAIVDAIVALAQGVPYAAQLLALRAGQAALRHGSGAIAPKNLITAVLQVLEEFDPRVVALYEALEREQDRAMSRMLRTVVAAGPHDSLGRYRAEERGVRVHVGGCAFPRDLWHHLTASGTMRPCVGAESGLFTFSEATFGFYVRLRAWTGALSSGPGRGESSDPERV